MRRGCCGRFWGRSASSPVLCADITGPIILQSYRAIADYQKGSGSEMGLAAGDTVDVVEKSESGKPGPPHAASETGLPRPPSAQPSAVLLRWAVNPSTERQRNGVQAELQEGV